MEIRRASGGLKRGSDEPEVTIRGDLCCARPCTTEKEAGAKSPRRPRNQLSVTVRSHSGFRRRLRRRRLAARGFLHRGTGRLGLALGFVGHGLDLGGSVFGPACRRAANLPLPPEGNCKSDARPRSPLLGARSVLTVPFSRPLRALEVPIRGGVGPGKAVKRWPWHQSANPAKEKGFGGRQSG